jgi:hypothetical protein
MRLHTSTAHIHTPAQTTGDATANAGGEQLDQLRLGHVEQLLQLDTAVHELAEGTALLLLSL